MREGYSFLTTRNEITGIGHDSVTANDVLATVKGLFWSNYKRKN
jgi:hypothetical protein